MNGKMTKELSEVFTNEEMLAVIELARVALSDAELLNFMADRLDMSDEDITALHVKLEGYMEV